MKKSKIRFVIPLLVALLAGCATAKDVQQATDLIRTDNELTRLLVEVRPDDLERSAIYLNGLANHAKTEADRLAGEPGKESDAIAYYRIAATAFWRAGMSEDVNALFEVAEKGGNLCAGLENRAPDRDCLFLRLVIPFAGLEAKAKEQDPSDLLETVNFNDGSASPVEIETMQQISTLLNEFKPLVIKIFDAGSDERFKSHAGMRTYYCNNAKKADEFYSPRALEFGTKVREFDQNLSGSAPPLGITVDSADSLIIPDSQYPSFCPR